MTDVNITIIGAGVVGLAIAAEISKNNYGIYVMEKHHKFGQETSSRNSEVIHSGIYYPTNSLKAKLCVEGRKLIYQYCKKNDVLFNRCGKLIVATDVNESKQLSQILKQSQINGVDDGYFVDKHEIYDMEPHIYAEQGIYFPSTGIVDSYGFMKQLERQCLIDGVEFAYNNEVVAVIKENDYYRISVAEGSGEYSFTTKIVINAAGLMADKIAYSVGLNKEEYEQHFWKGEYFAIGNGKNKLVNRLVYPVPNKNMTGLGVHATIDLNGGTKLGPNTIFLSDKKADYSVDSTHLHDFLLSAGKFLPFLSTEDLHPDQAGIRPKLQKPGDMVRDFIIREESDNGYPGFINLVGIDSPGLTSSLAIAKMVNQILSSITVTN